MYKRLFHAIIALLIFGSWIFLGSKSIKVGDFFLPPLGSFFCPSTGFWHNAESWHERRDGTINLPDMMDEATVYYNDRRVPYVYANHLIDLVRVQGFIHARDRLWQMDLNTRAAAGRISEILGERALAYDRRQRNYGLLHGAKESLKRLDGESKRLLQAYADGVNAYIEQLDPADYPLEFKLLDYKPQAWKPLNTALFMKNMQQTLAKKQEDLERTNTLAMMGRDSFQSLFPDWFPGQDPIISRDKAWTFDPLEPDTALPDPSVKVRKGQLASSPRGRGDGSNNWAVSGAKTRSGAPILCNDPHLGLNFPSIWYEMQLSTPNHTVYGVSFPGAPFIIIGFNEHIAWGITNGGHDVLDWYDIKWENRLQGQYRVGDSVLQAEARRDTIEIRNRQPLILRKWQTKFGSVWNEPGHPLDGAAMHWLANAPLPGNLFKTFMSLNRAEGYTDYKRALKHFDCPIQNFAFASKKDTIAIHTQGSYPVKPDQYGKFILDGSSEHDLPGKYIPYDQLPHEVNPDRNYVASANQHSTYPDYPYYYNGFFANYRGRYLTDRLDSMDQVGIEDMKQLQNDSRSIHPREGLKILKKYRDDIGWTPGQKDTLNQLIAWNGSFTAESWEAAFYKMWWDRFSTMTWDEFQSQGIPLLRPDDWKLVELALEQPKHDLFDRSKTSGEERVQNVVSQSFQRTFNLWDSLYTREGDPVDWALYNNARINHLAGLPGFGTDRMNIDGFKHALNAQTATKGPSWRMIVHLKDTIEAYGVYPGGQSGNPGSRYYDDQLDEWKQGEYFRINFAPDQAILRDSSYSKQIFQSSQ